MVVAQRTAGITMSLPANVVLPQTPQGETVRRFALGQTDVSYFDKYAPHLFAENMVFNGLLFKMKGRENIVPLYADFVKNKILSVKFEAIVEAGSKSRYLLLYFVKLVGQESEQPICDMLTLDDEGLIVRLENCFDTTKCPQDIVDAGAPTLAAFKED
ncbi:unnamed protein product [Choristocarpus tenellus]